MPLELVIGPANSAKAGEVLGAYGAAAARGAVLVVPTSQDAYHYRRELARAGVVFGSVLTFSELMHEIARRTGYSARPLSSLQRDRVVRGVLGRLSWHTLAGPSTAPGFWRAAADLIAELQRELVTPQRFVAALRTWAAEDPRRAPYADDLGHIYHHYIRELERRGRVDRELYTWRTLDALRARPAAWGNDHVFFYGFDELTGLQRDAVQTLSRIAGVPVVVSLTYEAGRAALRARASAVQELAAVAERVRELPALDEHYAPGSRAALHHLERHLFEPVVEQIDAGAAVALLESGGERAEAELVAGQVLALLREGVKGGEIAVVFRRVRQAAALLESVFAQYGIPLRTERELPLTHTPLGRALRGAARCALLDEHRACPEDLLDYLRAPGVLEWAEIADRLEAEVRRHCLLTAADARRRLGRDLPELDMLAACEQPGPQLCRLAGWLLAAPHGAAAPLLPPTDALNARALSTLVRAFDELAELGVAPAGSEVVELLDELVIEAAGPGGEDEVWLAEPLEIRARRFRVVFVCALQEGGFPLPAAPEPFLPDELRRELAISSGLVLHAGEDTLDRERYLLYTTLSRATERVVLSYRSSDEEGNMALPSPFIADVAELFEEEWRASRDRRLLSDVVWDLSQAPTERERERALAAASAAGHGDAPEPARRLTALARERLRHLEILSAGALETYADCPVKWLVERELRPEPLHPDPEPIVRGNVMHETLEQVFLELGGPVTADSLARALEILDRVVAEFARGERGPVQLGVGRPGIVRAGALRAIEADLRRYLRHEAAAGGDWRPVALELRFGFDDAAGSLPVRELGDGADRSLPALELGHGEERVRVRGAIDRVDVDRTGRAIVRDYKSGGSRPAYPVARWVSERQLQVALYLIVVRELAGLQPAGGFYQPLRGEDLRPRGMFVKGTDVGSAVPNDARERDEFAAQLQDAASRAVRIGAALRSGDLTPCPQTCWRDGCAYPGICRSQ